MTTFPYFHRVNLGVLGFTTTYKTARGTAKVPGSRIRHRISWVGLWLRNSSSGLRDLMDFQ